MRIVLIFLFAWGLGAINCSAQTISFKNISAEQFKELLATQKGILLDVRTPEEYAQGHLAGSLNLNFYEPDFGFKLKKYAAGKTALIYCASGGRSAKAATLLQSNNAAPVYNLTGGIAAWRKAGYPVVK